MASSTRSDVLREREEERRLNMRTLVIASVASATAAAVTSQLWIHGTWIAAALTPALVALISEAMHRPTERIARAWTSDRPVLGVGAARHADRPAPDDDPLPRRAGPKADPVPRAAAPSPRGGTPDRRAGAPGPVRVYRQPGARPPRRRLALGAVAATAAIAFIVAVIALTAGDLVSGGSIGKGAGRTTLFGGDGKSRQPQQDTTPTQTAPDETAPDETPTTTDEAPPATETPSEPPPSDTAPTTPLPEAPPGEPAPNAAPSP
jgi:hypothetical protein